ncbi:putative germin-like protein 2-1 [Abrus precatorius]|uniref:Germin-like protein n=1 Tax=Abrus precatorius TaxID=3816 RepID=A0A8B8JQQ4_ABRPR|nr:putative germin-like protein 2-1 [Abrus precatorius]
MANLSLLLAVLALSLSAALAVDTSALQDFCVADPNGAVLVNGLVCKDPKLVEPNDFYFSGLDIAGNITNPVGSKVTPVFATELPGLNTLGISIARIDFAPWGINPPHIHPRASEILTVLEGSLEVGFITSNPENRHLRKVLQKGDVFVFPIGLIHYQRNVGYANAVAIAALSSQNPGVITIANAVFGSTPDIASDILAKAFYLDNATVNYLQSKF